MIPDEGTVALQAIRFVQGQLPHRDYFIQTPWSGDLWVGSWFCLFGDSLESLRGYFLLEMGILAACIQCFSARYLTRGWSELPTLMFLSNNPFCWFVASPRWDAALLLLLALLQLNSPRGSFRAGILVGLAALTQHPSGAAGAVGILVGLLFQRPLNWKSVRWFGYGILSIWFPFVLFLAAQNLVATFFYDVIFFNVIHYAGTQGSTIHWHSFVDNFQAAGQAATALFSSWSWAQLLFFLKLLGYAVVDVATYGLWFPISGLGLFYALYRRDRDLVCLTSTLTLLTLFELVRPNRYHFQFHSPFVLITGVILAYQLGRSGKACLLLLLAAHGAVLVGHIQSNQGCNQMVATPQGILYVRDPETAQIMRQFVEINAELPQGEKLFVFPDNPMLQWLLGRGPVTREVAAIPCFFTLDQFEAIKAALKREHVENLCHIPLHINPADYPEISVTESHNQEAWLVKYLSEGYLPYRSLAGVTFYRRSELLDHGKIRARPQSGQAGAL